MLKKKQVVAIVSIALVCFLVGTSMASDGGSPWNKVWEAIYSLESRVGALEEQSIPQGFMGVPAYDSGWFSIDQNEDITFTHNLNTDELFVYLIGRSHYGGPDSPDFMKIHQEDYGDLDWVCGEAGHGCCWSRLDNTTITVRRGGNDEGWSEARVMTWIIQEPST